MATPPFRRFSDGGVPKRRDRGATA